MEATNGLLWVARVPEPELTIAHARKARGRNAVRFTHPNSAAVLGAWVTGDFLRRLLLAYIPHAQLLVSARGHEQRTVGVPRQRLYNVVVLEGEVCDTGLDIPQLDGVVARGGGEDVLGSRVEEDMADFPTRLLDSSSDRTEARLRTSCGRSALRPGRHRQALRRRCAV